MMDSLQERIEEDARWRKVAADNLLPPIPPGMASEMRYNMRNDAWHVRVDGRWMFCDGRNKKEWVPSYYGPTA